MAVDVKITESIKADPRCSRDDRLVWIDLLFLFRSKWIGNTAAHTDPGSLTSLSLDRVEVAACAGRSAWRGVNSALTRIQPHAEFTYVLEGHKVRFEWPNLPLLLRTPGAVCVPVRPEIVPDGSGKEKEKKKKTKNTPRPTAAAGLPPRSGPVRSGLSKSQRPPEIVEAWERFNAHRSRYLKQAERGGKPLALDDARARKVERIMAAHPDHGLDVLARIVDGYAWEQREQIILGGGSESGRGGDRFDAWRYFKAENLLVAENVTKRLESWDEGHDLVGPGPWCRDVVEGREPGVEEDHAAAYRAEEARKKAKFDAEMSEELTKRRESREEIAMLGRTPRGQYN